MQMRTDCDLVRELERIDGRGYPAYKDVRGGYDFGDFQLHIEHVQGDPFAAPSRMRAQVPADALGIPEGMWNARHRRTALEDVLLRRFARALASFSMRAGGSGKSGVLATASPGPEVLSRSACEVRDGAVTLRFEAGLPARGRTVDGRAAARMLLDFVPACIDRTLFADDGLLDQAWAAVELADDQRAAREKMEELGLVGFVANGSVLPRESGVSKRPMADVLPFESPEEQRVVLNLPHRGDVAGMGIKRGVTLIVGGGYHGKSTLLQALQDGVYDHVAGDGRELVLTDPSAVKLRAEDGRAVSGVDISLFIRELPGGRDTSCFSTVDASGSTSQAASTVEALEAGARTLLIDEDTSATNFMVRDALMEAVVAREFEPITPFAERVRDLWEQAGVSCVIVAGSSGAYFSVADCVLQLDRYRVVDITSHARAVCEHLDAPVTPRAAAFELPGAGHVLGTAFGGAPGSRARGAGRGAVGDGGRGGVGGGRGGRAMGPGGGFESGGPRGRGMAGERAKVRTSGCDSLQVGDGLADVRLVEQLVDPAQTRAIAQLLRVGLQRGVVAPGVPVARAARELGALLDREGFSVLAEHGDAPCDLARPRLHELAAVLNRWRRS
ncbi:ABC-ATPase domain-containing protein [Collinsella sp. D33t1_170424_A12]|uniref:ABC-ATPase domain-containing protein n=1 Tax=Collinsella sp. D33t1_170424_A12 TaxID=2787135 RepID=UPI001E3822BB|nr:ABC-ATPase domain-containing protein [Collinsella sp. D33t1_170424_A12]